MLKCGWKNSYRQFHALGPVSGSQVREKLKSFEQRHTLLNKSSKELIRLNEKKLLRLKKLRKTAYSKQQAIHLLNKKHGISSSDAEKLEIGPTSQSDLKFLSVTKDRRMLYTMLGVNGEQLRDSKLIADDVKKFLKRGQVEKAVFLVRLAKKKGAAAMNSIMEYYFYDLKYPQSAIKMYNWRKKWDIPPNEYTNTILFKGLAQQEECVSKGAAALVMRIVDGLISQEKLSQIEFNAALGAFANCTDVTPAFELFEKKVKGIKPDAITYLWMLRACSRVKTDQLFGKALGELMEKMPARCVDSQLLFEFCKTLSARSENQETRRLALTALNEYFDFGMDDLSIPEVPNGLALLPLSHWSIEHKFPLTKHVVGLFLNNCLQTGEYDLGVKVFQTMKAEDKRLIDLDMSHKYMEIIIKKDPKHCSEECLKIFEELEPLGAFSKHSIILIYKSFEKQASKKFTNSDEERAEKILDACHNFIVDHEGVYSKEFKQRVYPLKSWQFYVTIFKNANAHDKVSSARLKLMINESMKSICHGVFDLKNLDKDQLTVSRFVLLEFIRLLKTLAKRLEVSDLKEIEPSIEGPERDNFLGRRLLLRLKDKLLEHVKLIETKEQDPAVIDGLNWSLRQLSQRVLSSKMTFNNPKQG